jgi:hypothetical protein
MEHAVPRNLTDVSTFAELSIYNESPEFVDFFTAFKQRMNQAGVRAREFNTREDYETSLSVVRTRRVKNAFGCALHASDRLTIQLGGPGGLSVEPVPGVARPLVPVKPLRSLRPLILRPSDGDLAVEDVMGTIVRDGTLVAVGCGEKLLALYAKDQTGSLLNSYGNETFVWKQIADRICGITHNLWVMKTAQAGVVGDVRTTGMDVPLMIVPGVGIDELLNARFTGAKTFSTTCSQAATIVCSQIREVVQRRVVAPLRATGSDLVEQITRDMRQGSSPRLRSLTAQLEGDVVTSDPLMPSEKRFQSALSRSCAGTRGFCQTARKWGWLTAYREMRLTGELGFTVRNGVRDVRLITLIVYGQREWFVCRLSVRLSSCFTRP